MKQANITLIYCLILLICLLLLTGCGQKRLASSQPAPLSDISSIYPLTIKNYDSQEQSLFYTYLRRPEKVVITHPGATELLLELGLGDRILSTVAPYGAPLDRLASQYALLPIMASQYNPSQEELLELQPQMIIGWAHQFTGHGLGEAQTWNQRGIGTFIMPSTLTKVDPTLETIVYPSILDIGKIFNIQDKSELYVKQMKERVAALEDKVKNLPKKKSVLVLQSHGNGTFSIYDTHYLISHMIAIAGGENLCDAPAAFVGAEKVLSFDPDFIIFVTTNLKDQQKDLTEQEGIAELQSIKELRSMRSIRAGSILPLPFFTVNNGGIRTVDTIEIIAKTLYPENFK